MTLLKKIFQSVFFFHFAVVALLSALAYATYIANDHMPEKCRKIIEEHGIHSMNREEYQRCIIFHKDKK